jgi:hypothetical protein
MGRWQHLRQPKVPVASQIQAPDTFLVSPLREAPAYPLDFTSDNQADWKQT